MNYTIGIIGGGQLGKMLMESGAKWDIKFNVLESEKSNSICDKLADKVIRGSLHDPIKIREIVESSDVTTFEIENVNVDVLIELEEKGHKIIPSPKILKIIQNKGKQKDLFSEFNIPTAEYFITDSLELCEFMNNLDKDDKYVVKSCVGGYDGNGVVTSDKFNAKDMDSDIWDEVIVEKFVDFEKELSVIVASDQFNNIVCYPIVEMVFNKCNTLDYQICPARINEETEKLAYKIATNVVDKLDGIGLYAIEMFLTKDGDILVNEVAPRPHNSGHHTIEGCLTSQFEQLLRILLGIYLGPVDLIKPSIMINLLGPREYIGEYEVYVYDIFDLHKNYNSHLHLYGKSPSKPNRKLGHITILGDSIEDLENRLDDIKSKSRIIPIHNESTKQNINVKPIVGVIMGSKSDMPVMKDTIDILKEFNIPYEIHIVSAHRTPDRMFEYSKSADDRGLKIIIAGAGGAAHLPGMVASLTNLPVIGVPVKSSTMSGLDSLYSIVQMPRGVPVATMAINGSKNAGLLAVKILANHNRELKRMLINYSKNMYDLVIEDDKNLVR